MWSDCPSARCPSSVRTVSARRHTRYVPAALGITRANPQFGPGGAPQLFLPNYEEALEPIYSVPLRNTRVP